MQSSTAKSKNPFALMYQYFRESKEELGKVSWPSREDTMKYSIAVIVMSVVVGAYFFGLDKLFSFGLEKLLQVTS